MATIYYTASSIDGYIVDDRDSLEWLIHRNIDADGPFGYRAFADSVGALVMGATTYEWILANDSEWQYKQPTWVLTHRPEIVAEGRSRQGLPGRCVRVARTAGARRRAIRTSGWSAGAMRPHSSQPRG